MRIYMDVCCYNRPMDDQTQERIRIEAGAITRILQNCVEKGWDLIGSIVVEYELNNHTDKIKQREAFKIYNYAKIIYNIFDYPDAKYRANEFQLLGVGAMDSLHLAISECAEVDILLTTDDRFINTAKRSNSKVRVVNPTVWCEEVFNNE